MLCLCSTYFCCGNFGHLLRAPNGVGQREEQQGALVVSVALVVFVFGLATYPGELLYKNAPFGFTHLRKMLFEGDVDFVTLRPKSLLSNRLVLPGIDVIDHAKFDTEAKIAALPESVSLRGRSFEGAVFVSARLRKVDFTGAHLQGAEFLRADLRGARFDCGDDAVAETCADLRGADFHRAQLQGAYFDGARLQAAAFQYAQLQGASFDKSQLQGASLRKAQLMGTFFQDAQLQGVSFVDAVVQDALFLSPSVWKSDPPTAANGIRVVAPETSPKYRGFDCAVSAKDPPCTWSASSYAALKSIIDLWVAEEDRPDSLKRIIVLAPAQPSGQSSPDRSSFWLDLAQKPSDNEKEFAARLRHLACDGTSAIYVSHGIAHNLAARFKKDSVELGALANALLDAKQCGGSLGLSGRNKFDLQEIVDAAKPSNTP